MATRRLLLLRLWVVATISIVAAIAGTAWWWEKQLPGKLQQAVQEGDLEACLKYGEQLAALRWLGSGAPEEQAFCRRRQAEKLWNDGQVSAALKLQTQLVESALGNAESQRRDRDRLALWQDQLRNRALVLFRDGELGKALETLAPLTPASAPGSSALSDTLKETWNRNRLNHERIKELVEAERWWEALDHLNRLDHPWWQEQAQTQRQIVETAIAELRATEEHQQHGESGPDVISGPKLDAAVQTSLDAGNDPWDAFLSACDELGGLVIEDGPESFCRRISDGSP
ncbi:hypothetical protein KR100_13415 [Synechococcus sp. KORDI-100]|uniref:hypothetical protein n=1 Tax=Synechococcus sp. KORDI-100 TaxID=1280380 RepID=UPI0004E06B94|nr:hypothetical protein [Synechococcus sp. KORDI-100]AII44346.1 hypothetical protein KR100_13415 [Synechococcus sp. KORDI-100]